MVGARPRGFPVSIAGVYSRRQRNPFPRYGAGLIDFHNHLLPGVDDGAATLDESRAGLLAMAEQGVRTVVVTPHLNASTTEDVRSLARAMELLDPAFEQLSALVASELPSVTVSRAVELMLDSPAPDLADPRLRIAGSSAVLVEFPALLVPPHSVQALYNLRLQGWRPVIAHPERYRQEYDPALISEWRGVGAAIQVNSGSLLGRYGEHAKRIAWALLESGLADFLASDYHARGRLSVAEARQRLEEAGAEEQARLLLEDNPRRLLADEALESVPPLETRRPFWRRLLGGDR